MMSSRSVRTALFGLLAAVSAMGQVDLGLEIENSTVLRHEPLMAHVTVLNGGAVPLVINAAGGVGPQLRFIVEHNSGRSAVRRQGGALASLTLQPGQAQMLEVDLTMHFVLTQADRYFVRAVLDAGGGQARSSLKAVDVVPGIELEAVTGTVPRAPGVQRTYSLRYWGRKQKEHAFLCVSESPSGRTFAPIYLGAIIRVVRPTVTVGKDGAVTVKHQVNRSQMMVSTLRSRRDKLTLVSQKPVRITTAAPPKAPARLPRK
jgi:hypothetical protein